MRHAVTKKFKEASSVPTEAPPYSSDVSPLPPTDQIGCSEPPSRTSDILPILFSPSNSETKVKQKTVAEAGSPEAATRYASQSKKKTGTLHMVAVPIGCAEDISLRALRVLRTVAIIICENISVSRNLIEQFGIECSLLRYAAPTANEQESSENSWLRILKGGDDVAFLCDAGMPGIADPGRSLVRIALQHNLPVSVLPGPTACLTALVASGLPTNRFAFDGFPPRLKTEREAFFQRFVEEERTIILYESGRRLRSTLVTLSQVVEPSRQITIVSNLTHPTENWVRASLQETIDYFCKVTPIGEYTMVIAGFINNINTKYK